MSTRSQQPPAHLLTDQAGDFSSPDSPVPMSPSGQTQSEMARRCAPVAGFLRSLCGFLLSHVGLLTLVVGYCMAGAFIFEKLESENEREVKQRMITEREQVTEDLWVITRSDHSLRLCRTSVVSYIPVRMVSWCFFSSSLSSSSSRVLAEGNWTQNVTDRLKKFEHTLLKAMKEQGWDGVEGGEAVNWTFTGALFYAITVITTIGYGHIAPKTIAAKIVTIFYAILGIPLTVLCWSNIGDAMANAFRWGALIPFLPF